MSFLVVAGGVAVVTFLLLHLRSGRFGAVVLSLGIGYLLSFLWLSDLSSLNLMEVPLLSWQDAVYAGLVLLPGLLALLLSPKKKTVLPKIVAATMVAVLVVALMLPIMRFEGQGGYIYDSLHSYRDVVITGVLALGLFDTFFARLPKAPRRNRSSD